MINGVEIRKNGNEIRKVTNDYGFSMYYIYIALGNGMYEVSKNNPWDYLNNARTEADKDNKEVDNGSN